VNLTKKKELKKPEGNETRPPLSNEETNGRNVTPNGEEEKMRHGEEGRKKGGRGGVGCGGDEEEEEEAVAVTTPSWQIKNVDKLSKQTGQHEKEE
jgi:hypothetical protein